MIKKILEDLKWKIDCMKGIVELKDDEYIEVNMKISEIKYLIKYLESKIEE